MIEIGLKDVAINFGGDDILNGVTFDIQEKERLGLIGNNGTGKTTILRLITGEEKPEKGFISFRKDVTLGYLRQVPTKWDKKTVEEVLQSVFLQLIKMKERLNQLEEQMSSAEPSQLEILMQEYGHLQQLFDQKGGYKFQIKIDTISSGLKISDTMRRRSFSSLSGGEKTRIMLARILLENPDVLLLDEPTNHLDIDSVEWLESFLKEYDGAVLIVSHDRYFLDNVVTKIVELEMGVINNYQGNYSFFQVEKQRRFDAQFAEYKDVQKKIKAMKAAADRFRVWGNINSDNAAHMARAKRLEEKIEELKKIRKPLTDKKIGLDFNQGSRSGKDVLVCKKLSFGYGEKQLFQRAEMNIRYRERVAILGANGSGKTTLFRMFNNDLSPQSGEVVVGSGVVIGYLAQEVTFQRDDLTIVDLYRYHYPMTEGDARNELARFLFYGTDVYKDVKALSGGEKVRLKLALLNKESYNLLILDEPTNHLDIFAREKMEEALKEFSGTIIFISHDRYFINKFAQRILELDNKKLKEYLGNYEYYKEKKELYKAKKSVKKKIKLSSENGNKKSEWLLEQNQKKKALQKYENLISNLETAIETIDASISESQEDYELLEDLFNKREIIQKDLDEVYLQWEEIQD